MALFAHHKAIITKRQKTAGTDKSTLPLHRPSINKTPKIKISALFTKAYKEVGPMSGLTGFTQTQDTPKSGNYPLSFNRLRETCAYHTGHTNPHKAGHAQKQNVILDKKSQPLDIIRQLA